ncbi:hypothetical protein FGIG_04132 [Fasciola gigantica]|uniref:BHLH domain-containing protein n=1 Tax=Fasciola gigantica TaxID=46835 RepID=A0A504YZG7_FASGI|nr:hypothetical protein FGIG_04132 [Fasciola gigantica]
MFDLPVSLFVQLKKQDMERRRRACISDKMNALHDLAMRVIGVEPSGQHRLEKADILGTCYAVLEGVAKLASDDSALRSRLHGLRSHIQDRDMSRDITMPDEATQSSTASGESLQTESLGTNKENQMHEQPNTPCHLQDSIATRFPWSLTSTPRSPLVPCPMTVTQAAPGSSLHDSGFHSSQEASMTTKFGSSFRSPLASLSVSPYMSNEMLREAIQVSNSRAVPSSTHISAFKPIRPAKIKTTHVWRPYLD